MAAQEATMSAEVPYPNPAAPLAALTMTNCAQHIHIRITIGDRWLEIALDIDQSVDFVQKMVERINFMRALSNISPALQRPAAGSA
jgi:hypothetical protein